jgi:hypothetical protein
MAKDYSIYVLLRCWANISDQRGARGEPGDNRRQAIYMHVPVHVRRTCGVEINIERGDCDKEICDRNSANSPPVALQQFSASSAQPSVVRHECPVLVVSTRCRRAQQLGPIVPSPALSSQPKSSESHLELGMAVLSGERACASRGCCCGLARHEHPRHPHDTTSLCCVKRFRVPCAQSVWLVSLVVAGTSPAGPVATSTAVWPGTPGQPWVRKDTINVLCPPPISLATLDSVSIRGGSYASR